jgi:hypothetical protein
VFLGNLRYGREPFIVLLSTALREVLARPIPRQAPLHTFTFAAVSARQAGVLDQAAREFPALQ